MLYILWRDYPGSLMPKYLTDMTDLWIFVGSYILPKSQPSLPEVTSEQILRGAQIVLEVFLEQKLKLGIGRS